MVGSPTRTNYGATEWQINDEVLQLRDWGADLVHRLPNEPQQIATIGTAETCWLRLTDPSGFASRKHAYLERRGPRWTVRDNGSRNGLRIDGARRTESLLEPGVELGIGGMTLLAESPRFIELRRFLARLLGYGIERMATVDHALRSIRLAATRRLPLVLSGDEDLVPVAQAIHRHVLGDGKPFVVCDPRRRRGDANVRSAASVETGREGLQRALGGSLCVTSKRLPADFKQVRSALRDPAARIQLIVCADVHSERKLNSLYCIDPIVIPSLETRRHELARIIDECAIEAAAALLTTASLTDSDREWLTRSSASSVNEIEKSIIRLLAVREHSGELAAAARALGMNGASLDAWFQRRHLPKAALRRRRI